MGFMFGLNAIHERNVDLTSLYKIYLACFFGISLFVVCSVGYFASALKILDLNMGNGKPVPLMVNWVFLVILTLFNVVRAFDLRDLMPHIFPSILMNRFDDVRNYNTRFIEHSLTFALIGVMFPFYVQQTAFIFFVNVILSGVIILFVLDQDSLLISMLAAALHLIYLINIAPFLSDAQLLAFTSHGLISHIVADKLRDLAMTHKEYTNEEQVGIMLRIWDRMIAGFLVTFVMSPVLC